METTKQQVKFIPFWLENLIALVVLISACSLFTGFIIISAHQTWLIEQNKYVFIPPSSLPYNPFDNLELEAGSAIVWDVVHGQQLFGLNEETQLPLASLTKLMTALVALETAPDYLTVTVSATSTNADGRLRPGERWKLKDLVDYTLISSSNYGAESIAGVIGSIKEGKGTAADSEPRYINSFITSMNAIAAKLGMSQTYYLNSSGLDESEQLSGAYGSAKDTAILFSYIMNNRPDIVEATKYSSRDFTSLDDHSIEAINTDPIVNKIPGIMGSKTGFTDLALGNLAIAFDAAVGEPYVIVVLHSTENGRFSDTEKLVNATIEYLGTRNKKISPKAVAESQVSTQTMLLEQ